MKKSIGLSILLIISGVVFLLDNLNYIDISVREIISTYWPLVLIFIGGEKLLRDLK
jgi:lia operon protein LiaF